MQVGTNKWDVETYRKKLKKVVWFAKRGAKKINKISHREICRRLSAPQHSVGVSECQKSWGGGHNLPPPDWNRVNVSAKNC